MPPSSTSTLTIRPWTPQAPSTDPTSALRDVLSRAQRGHLRDITESSLQEELATEGALDLDSASDASESSDDDEEPTKEALPFGKPSTREDLFNAKRYMLQAIGAAQQEISIALDVASLIVSKDAPRQAETTLGEHLKQNVPRGTLGVDFWQRMPADPAREAQDALLAANVKMQGLQNAADGLLGAAKRMQDTVKRETEYWDQILSISSRGWNVCRVPGQQHRLGVRFGFSESAPRFVRKGIAALKFDESEGGIYLDRGIGSATPGTGLRVTLKRQGKVVGVSRAPEVREEGEMTLESRIRQARDGLFDEELYHEIIRESRTLASLGVTVEGSTINLRNSSQPGKDDLELAFDLAPPEAPANNPELNDEDSALAQATLLTARILLSQAHRDRLRKRSQLPPPLSERQKDDQPPVLPILRPLMAFMFHHSALAQLNDYVRSIDAVLSAARIENDVQQATFGLPTSQETATAEQLISTTLLRPLVSEASITLRMPSPSPQSTEPYTFNLILTTSLATSFGPVFSLRFPFLPATDPNQQPQTFTFPSSFQSFASATSASLASNLASAILAVVRAESHGGEDWQLRADEGVVERDVGIGQREERFGVELDVEGEEAGLRLVVEGARGGVFRWVAAAWTESGDAEARESERRPFFEVATDCISK